MVSPGHIRLFATTDDSALGRAALAYAKSLMRIAPVRLVTFSGTLEGPWRPFGELLGTPMTGTGITAVATDPGRWVWSLAIPMPNEDGGAQAIVAADNLGHLGDHDMLKESAELYTPGQRNVLFAWARPRDARQLQTAEKYDAIVVPVEADYTWWRQHSHRDLRWVACEPTVNHDAIRNIVLGAPT